MNTPPNIKKTWIKPFVKVVSVKKDTYGTTKNLQTAEKPATQPWGEWD
jgi:hypothetical protein